MDRRPRKRGAAGLPEEAGAAADGAMPSIMSIIEEHAEDAAFLWCLRDVATDQPHIALRDLADLEARIEAHIDGLHVSGEAGTAIAWANLDRLCWTGELFTVATLAFEGRDAPRIEQTLEFGDALPDSRRGLFGAIGWVPPAALQGHVVTWLEAPSPFRRLAGVVACSLHRVDPGSIIDRLLVDDEPIVRARALRLVAELGRLDCRQHVRLALSDEDEACRFWAAWSAGLLDERTAAIPILQAHAAGGSRFKWRAVDLLFRLIDRDAAIAWLREAGQDSANARLIVVAAGVLGDPIVVPWLLDRMGVAGLERVAGESFSLITGVDLSKAKLDRDAPESLEEAEEQRVAADADEHLPWPASAKVRGWWEKERARFAEGIRHLKGRPLSGQGCADVWRDGRQRERRSAAYELALMNPGRPLLNWRARASLQTKNLSAPPPA